MRRSGPRRVAVCAGDLYGVGVAFASLSADRLAVLYVTYGLIAGAGVGLGYIVPIATLVKWFPDRRGLITGLAVSGVAAGSLIAAPIAAELIETAGVGFISESAPMARDLVGVGAVAVGGLVGTGFIGDAVGRIA